MNGLTIELFCGTKSFSKAADKHGFKTFTLDNNPDFEPDLCCDILDLNIEELKKLGQPFIIWASPPCQAFSVCVISRNWRHGQPISDKANLGIRLLEKSIQVIKELKPKYFFIENPVGMMRKQHILMPYLRKTVSYCQYGDIRRKPTDIWTNLEGWQPKHCSNGALCHQASPRSESRISKSKNQSGTQGLKNAKERGRIPKMLFDEIFKSIENVEKKRGV